VAFIETVGEDEAAGPVAAMYETDRETFGFVPNFTKAYSARPAVYAAWRQLNGAIKANMDLRRYELATLAAQVAEDPGSVTEADVERLRAAGLTDPEILDVVLAAAARCFFSTTLDALGAEPDAKYAELDADVRDALTVGRAIARS